MTTRYDPKNMKFRNLGPSGLRVSVLSFGGWLTLGGSEGQEQTTELMKTAFEAGINSFDTAEGYGKGQSEVMMGQSIKDLKWNRSELVLTTKIFFGSGPDPNGRGLSRKHIIEAADASLKRADLAYWDVIHAHRFDYSVPVEEVVRAFNFLIDTGRCFYWATSEWSAQQIEEAHNVANRLGLSPPICDQPQYSMLHRERFEVEYLPLYKNYRWGTTIWSPLASGLLTGKYNDGIPEDSRFATNSEFFKDTVASLKTPEGLAKIEKIKKLTVIAEELGTKMATLALAWCLKNENVSTIILGGTKPQQIKDNVQALDVVEKLDEKIMARIEEILDNKPKAPVTYGRGPRSYGPARSRL